LHKIHRWISLVFALPLAVVIVTGLVLSFEPALVTGKGPVAVTADTVTAALRQYDPDGKARGLFVRGYAGNISLMGSGGPGAMTTIDLATNTRVDDPGFLAVVFGTSRRVHEKLVLDMGWLVTASTIAMLVLIVFGIMMGWPRLRNTLSGWHKGTAWILLPLVVLSPLTGLFMAFGVPFAGTPVPAAKAAPLPIAEAVRIVAGEHDLSRLSWIRSRGNSLLARVEVDGEMRVYNVSRNGLTPTARNWPRLIHEGNWGGWLSVAINVVTSLALVVLLGSGLVLWARRRLRPRASRQLRPATP
jgi:uncharacterized iron-regulated membrane protein